MKLQIDYISDLYLDKTYVNRSDINTSIIKSIPDKPSDILIIAGNLAKDMNVILNSLLEYKKIYTYVIYVNGMYEMQMTNNEKKLFDNNSFKKINTIKNFIDNSTFDGIMFLDGFDKQKIFLPEYQISFSGLSMFWDYSGLPNNLTNREITSLYESLFPEEYSEISFGNDTKITPSKLFKNNFKRLSKLDTCDIMVTNYCPLNTEKNFGCFDGKQCIENIKPKIWFFGNHLDFVDTTFGPSLLINTFDIDKKIKTIITNTSTGGLL